MNKMLSYPFFRGKGDISFSERIENNIFFRCAVLF